QIPPAQRVPQLPDAIALRPEAVADDQRRRLDRRDHVQPYARHDEAHGETGETRCESADEGSEEKQSDNNAIHGPLLRSRRAALGWRVPSRGEAAISPASNVSDAKNQGPANIVPSLRRRRCLGPAALQERGDRRKPRFISLAHCALVRKRGWPTESGPDLSFDPSGSLTINAGGRIIGRRCKARRPIEQRTPAAQHWHSAQSPMAHLDIVSVGTAAYGPP